MSATNVKTTNPNAPVTQNGTETIVPAGKTKRSAKTNAPDRFAWTMEYANAKTKAVKNVNAMKDTLANTVNAESQITTTANPFCPVWSRKPTKSGTQRRKI